MQMNKTNIIPLVDKSILPKQCVIYTWVDTEIDSNMASSLENQRYLCKKRAKKNGLVILNIFEDVGESSYPSFRQ
jgi:DNA invertase Pin-like site-specific DNA recombinase